MFFEHLLVGAHAGLGELGIAAFLWVAIELISSQPTNLRRARIVALLGTIFLVLSWVVGGFYYVVHYGPEVKPIIKLGPMPWTHGVVMETKEHVFLFLPFLAASVTIALYGLRDLLVQRQDLRRLLIVLCATIIFLGGVMAAMGYLISTGVRHGLEVTSLFKLIVTYV